MKRRRCSPLDLKSSLESSAPMARTVGSEPVSSRSVEYEQLFTVDQLADLGPTENAPAAARQFARSVL
jgi:hypothetical protein